MSFEAHAKQGTMMKRAFLAAGALAIALASPANAQDKAAAAPADQGKLAGDYLIVGAGAGYGPSYEGSNDYRIFPVPLVQGRLGGVGIGPRAGGVALDFIPDRPGKVGFNLGIASKIRLNRARQTNDPVVDRLGKLKTAVEVGPTIGLTFPHVLNAYDRFSVTTDFLWDVAGAHKGMVIDPLVSYSTPLSRGILANLSANAEWGDGKFSRYNYSVTPAGSLASGLPVFTARHGFNKAGARLLVGFDLDGDITNGGPAIFVLGGYTRMLGDARRTPITRIRGSANQLMAVAGLAYTF
jgi:outer membrane scaffolding protein for murein synthesis (MipA/OmpV family)